MFTIIGPESVTRHPRERDQAADAPGCARSALYICSAGNVDIDRPDEPELVDAAYWEFSEATGKFLAKAETILPPYRFGVYDLLVLPPSFPYGGMENACLTFLTPSARSAVQSWLKRGCLMRLTV